MRDTPKAGVAAIVLACSVAFGLGGAAAQTDSPGSASGAAGSAAAAPSSSPIAPTPDQVEVLIKELAGFASQPVSGFQPSVGASAPAELKTQPMPPAAAAAMPQSRDHHVAKTDDQTILIVDPFTRQVVGIISVTDSGTVGLGGSAQDSSDQAAPGQPDQVAPNPSGQAAPSAGSDGGKPDLDGGK